MTTRRQQLLEFAVLGLLHEGPQHGYELRKRLNLALGPFRALSFGTLYPALRTLAGAGFLTDSGAPTAVPGMSPTPSRRPKITYELTARGRERFAAMTRHVAPDAYEDEGFELRVAFFGRTESTARLRILEGRRARLEERLATLQTANRGRTARDSWSLALTRHTEDQIDRDLRWLGGLITAERGATSRPGTLTDPNHPAFTPPGHPGR